jgi:hypothetical protein
LESVRLETGTQGYVDADAYAQRLGRWLPLLGLDYLFVIFDAPMVCDLHTAPTYNIYSWWPSRGQPNVLLFSTAGLKVRTRGSDPRIALANITVGTLSGALMDTDSHESGARSCPNYYNGERDTKVLIRPQKFCRDCLKKMRPRYPKETQAFEAMLNVFKDHDMDPPA